jgi:hypothetical protein
MSPQVAPSGFDGHEKLVPIPVRDVGSGEAGPSVIAGGRPSRGPADEEGGQMIIDALP